MRIALTLVAALVLTAVSCKSTPAGESSRSVPGPEQATERAPAEFKARFSTSKGDFVVHVHREWAPNGADRFYNLVKIGFYDEARFFRVMQGFVAQWGIHADGDAVMSRWRNANITDDPPKQSNKRGTVSFATSGPNSRSTQVFVNFADNGRLDGMGFAPVGEVVEGMTVVDSLYSGYASTPDQPRIQLQGNAYLGREFPQLDYIKKAQIVP